MTNPVKTSFVDSFNLCLENFSGVLTSDEPIPAVEASLLLRLDSPIRLLRWAVVRVAEDGRFWVEGAYLKETR